MRARKSARSLCLSSIALRWALAAAVLGITLQTLFCLAQNFLNEAYFTRHFISFETQQIASAMAIKNGKLGLRDGATLPYFNDSTGAYGFRLFDAGGQLLMGHNQTLMGKVAPPALPDFWYRKDGADWLRFSGGAKHVIDGREVFIEIATMGDPRWRSVPVLLLELAEDVWVPLIPTLILTTLFLAFALQRALKPLCNAASQARALDVERGLKAFETTGLPREAAEFTESMNALMRRLETLMRSREHLASYVAHEVKTPLASMLLDLEQILDERARRLETDVIALSGTVDGILTFARSGKAATERVCLESIVRECVERAQIAARGGHQISVAVDSPAPALGYAAAARHAVQNVIDNAVKHTPPGTTIRVTCGPGPVVTVEDSGPGIPEATAVRLTRPFLRGKTEADGSGLGLAIAKHGVEMMGGVLEIGRSSLGGAAFRLRYAGEPGGLPNQQPT